jgi:hypothetical protein
MAKVVYSFPEDEPMDDYVALWLSRVGPVKKLEKLETTRQPTMLLVSSTRALHFQRLSPLA